MTTICPHHGVKCPHDSYRPMPRLTPGDPTRTINFRLPVDTFARLEQVAKADERSLNAMAVRLLSEALDARATKTKRATRRAAAA